MKLKAVTGIMLIPLLIGMLTFSSPATRASSFAGGDIAVTNVALSFSEAYHTWGDPMYEIYVNVTVLNNGTQTINCTVTAYYNASTWHEIGTQTVTDLAEGASTTLKFNWDLSNVPDNATYTVKANTTLLEGIDANPDNNEKVDGQAKVRLWGDVNGDGVVDIGDVKKFKLIYSGIIEEDPFAEVSGDGVFDIGDVKKVKMIYSGAFDTALALENH